MDFDEVRLYKFADRQLKLGTIGKTRYVSTDPDNRLIDVIFGDDFKPLKVNYDLKYDIPHVLDRLIGGRIDAANDASTYRPGDLVQINNIGGPTYEPARIVETKVISGQLFFDTLSRVIIYERDEQAMNKECRDLVKMQLDSMIFTSRTDLERLAVRSVDLTLRKVDEFRMRFGERPDLELTLDQMPALEHYRA